LGVDISHWNDKIDWPKFVEQSKPKFVFIKATEGLTVKDSLLETHRAGARAATLPTGYYHYLRPGDGTAQADYFLDALGADLGLLPLAADVEEGALKLSEVREFVDRLKARAPNKAVTIYTRASLWQEIGGNTAGQPDFSDCQLWVAHPEADAPILPADWTAYDYWQISWQCKLAGAGGNVDVNLYRGGSRPWYIRAMPYKALARKPGMPVPLYDAPGGRLLKTLNINWPVDVYEATLDGWIMVGRFPSLWADSASFKLP